MGRGQADATRERIREVATELFAEHGVAGASVRAIASGAGVSVAMISHHFGGKDALYQACLGAMVDELSELQEQLFTRLGGGESLAAALPEAVRTGFRYARSHRATVRLVMRHVLDEGELPLRNRASVHNPFMEAALEALSRTTGHPVVALRFALQSSLYLVTRYALASTADLTRTAGVAVVDEAQLLALVEDQLVGQLAGLLGLEVMEAASTGATR